MKYLEYIFCCLSKLHEHDHKNTMVYVIKIETEIKKWLELLVNNVDMFASDAGEFFKILCNELSPKELSEKYRNTVAVSVSY